MRTARIAALILTVALFLPFSSCSHTGGNNDDESHAAPSDEADITSASDTPESSESGTDKAEGADTMAITLSVGGKTFTATLADTGAARAFTDLLPLTLEMSELNGNEKYCYLDESLPTAASVPDKIRTGDIMLYGASCIVVFYKDFPTSYSYTVIGHIDDVTGLADALGKGSVTITFEENRTK